MSVRPIAGLGLAAVYRRLGPRPVWLVLILAAAMAGVGCGTGADRAQVRAVTERLYAAIRAGDGRAACAQLSPAVRAALVKDESASCPKAVLKLSLRGGRVVAVRVYATSAQAELAGGEAVFLGDAKVGWRIEALGCKRRASGPFECEEQA